MSEEAPSVREAIESAIATTSGDAPATSAPAAPAAAPPSQGSDAAAPQEAASGASPPGQTPSDAPVVPVKKIGEQQDLFGRPAKEKPPAAPAAPELKAPASWKADLRERWKGLSPDVQAEVIRREKEHNDRMQESAGLRRFAEKFREVSEPYRAIIESEGADPIKAFHDYLKTATLLRNGAPNDKARMLATLIQQYGVPLESLDAYLAMAIKQGPVPQNYPHPSQFPGQQQPQYAAQQMQPQQFRDPRLDAILEQQSAYERNVIQSDVQSFGADPKHEFFGDVRATMADVMDAAAKRGIKMTLDDAYVRACQIEPEVKKVLDQRAAQGNLGQAARRLAAARHAASSLPPASAPPAPKSNGSQPGSVRDAILNAIDTLHDAA
jgi:hypothetical protein